MQVTSEGERENSRKIAGEFSWGTEFSYIIKDMKCNPTGVRNSITHTSRDPKESIRADWEPQESDEGPYKLRITVVKNSMLNFWVLEKNLNTNETEIWDPVESILHD